MGIEWGLMIYSVKVNCGLNGYDQWRPVLEPKWQGRWTGKGVDCKIRHATKERKERNNERRKG